MRCAIVGLGRIGSAIYQDLAANLPYVIGLDIDPQRVTDLREAGFNATLDYRDCDDIDVWIIASASGPHMENIVSIASRISPKPCALISVESTLRVGTMKQLSDDFAARGYVAGKDCYLIHVPHRVMFGKDASTLSMPRVIGGVTAACLEMGVKFYGQLTDRLHPVPDVRIAELSKIVENSQRHVDIAFAEAIATYCDHNGLPFATVREAVNTKGNVSLANVDYGIGGECLPKDIEFLNDLAPSPIFAGAIESDLMYRQHLEDLAVKSGTRVLLRGVGYKPGIGDIYKSRAVDLAMLLMGRGCQVEIDDPLVPACELHRAGLKPADGVLEYDIVFLRGRPLIGPAEAQAVGEVASNGQDTCNR